MSIWIWVWLAVVSASLVLEFVTMEMVSIFFVIGGLVALILAACGVIIEVQIAVFIVISIISLLSFRKVALKYFSKGGIKTNVDSLIGKTFELEDAITKQKSGSIKINGITWTAVSEEETSIKKGTVVSIKSVQGNKVIVSKQEKKEEKETK